MDHGEIQGEPYLALEYVEGVSCRRILSEAGRQGRRLPAAAALYVVREVLSALDYLHAAHATVHRDVSPSNILVNRHGNITLIDLGITSGVGQSGSGADDFKGKPGYMAPEQVAGRCVDCRTDIFSAGAVLSEMLLGCPLFQGSGELELWLAMFEADLGVLTKQGQNLDHRVRELLTRALARDPMDRFQSAAEFRCALESTAAELHISLLEGDLLAPLYELGLVPAQSGVWPTFTAPRAEEDREGPTRPAAEPVALPQRQVRFYPGSVARSYRVLVDRRGSVHKARSSLTLPQLLEEVVTGSVRRIDGIGEGSAPPKPLEDHPLLGPISLRPEYAFDDALCGRRSGKSAVMRCPLDPPTLPERLGTLFKGAVTGLLVARDGSKQKRVYLDRGRPVLVASTDPTELLGARLVGAGWLGEAQLARAIEYAILWRCGLGEALVRIGALQAAPLLRFMVDQLRDRVAELGAWRQGELVFFPGEHSARRAPSLPPGCEVELVTSVIAAGCLQVSTNQ